MGGLGKHMSHEDKEFFDSKKKKIKCKNCKYYDDGCGNGEYCSGINAGPPSCDHPNNKKHKYDTPNGSNTERPEWCPKLKKNK